MPVCVCENESELLLYACVVVVVVDVLKSTGRKTRLSFEFFAFACGHFPWGFAFSSSTLSIRYTLRMAHTYLHIHTYTEKYTYIQLDPQTHTSTR